MLRDVMTVDVVHFSQDAKLSEVVKTMSERNIGTAVITEGERPIGIITERDIIKKVVTKGRGLEGLIAADVMTSPIVTITPEVDFENALLIMTSNHIKSLVVVEDDELSGIITTTDILRRTKEIAENNRKLTRYQTIQGYLFFLGIVAIFLIFVFKYLL
ncbi:CBS domain-containing protein [Candidatus Woesearchaeota archaeon]|nr:CBS domain-containing protein [Candidatus Woesearchaeota archaeon]